MTASHLSDDLSQWPRDPWGILGVPHSFSKLELKQAYTRLIRQFRPDSSPEAFQKIRGAYESLQHYANSSADQPALPVNLFEIVRELRQSVPDSEPLEETVAADKLQSASTGESSPSRPAPRKLKREPTPWELAMAGEISDAYRELERRLTSNPLSEDNVVQHYWLLTLFPPADTKTTPFDALLPYTMARGMQGRVGRLMARWLGAQPSFATKAQVWMLILHPASSDHRETLLRTRWLTLLQDDGEDVVLQELQELEPIYLDTPSEWLWLNTLVLELVVASRPRQYQRLVAQSRKAFQECSAEALNVPELFDRSDELFAVIRQVMEARDFDITRRQAVTRLMNRTTQVACQLESQPESLRRRAILALIDDWLLNLENTLLGLDELMKSGPSLLNRIRGAIDELWHEEFDDNVLLEGEELAAALEGEGDLCRTFMRPQMSHQAFRIRLLRFCQLHVADYAAVIDCLDETQSPKHDFASPSHHRLLRDLPLRCLIRGYLLRLT